MAAISKRKTPFGVFLVASDLRNYLPNAALRFLRAFSTAVRYASRAVAGATPDEQSDFAFAIAVSSELLSVAIAASTAVFRFAIAVSRPDLNALFAASTADFLTETADSIAC